jgi:hypothetical protein
MATLEERLDAGYADAFRPKRVDTRLEKPSEKLVGIVTDISLISSDYGDPYPCITVKQDDGKELAWHAFHTTSRGEVAKKQPQIGETIAVGYFGTGEPAKPGMSGPQLFRLVVDRDAQPFDYSQLGQNGGESAAETPADDIPF